MPKTTPVATPTVRITATDGLSAQQIDLPIDDEELLGISMDQADSWFDVQLGRATHYDRPGWEGSLMICATCKFSVGATTVKIEARAFDAATRPVVAPLLRCALVWAWRRIAASGELTEHIRI